MGDEYLFDFQGVSLGSAPKLLRVVYVNSKLNMKVSHLEWTSWFLLAFSYVGCEISMRMIHCINFGAGL
jgi:hypothetical protein